MLPTDLVASNGVESVENDVRAHVLDWRRDIPPLLAKMAFHGFG